MADYRRSEIVSGIFVVAAVGVFALFAFRVGNVQWILDLFRGRTVECVAYFTDVRTLDVGAKVSVAGRQVGAVRGLSIADRLVSAAEIERLRNDYGEDAFPDLDDKTHQARVRVEFELTNLDLPMDRMSARVSLVQDGVLGRHFLAFYPGHWKGEPKYASDLAGDGPIEIKVIEGADLSSLMATIRPLVRRIDGLLSTLRTEVFDDEVVDKIRDALLDLATLLDPEAKDGLHASLLRPVGNLASRTDASLNDEQQGLLVRAGAALEQGPQLVRSAERALAKAGDLLANNEQNIDATLEGLARATDELDDALAEVRGLLQENRPDVAESMRRLRRMLFQAEIAARKIRANPAVIMWGDNEADLQEQTRELSRTWRSGRARPYRQRDERDGK